MACTAGRYGNQTSKASATSCFSCTVGHYCPGGSALEPCAIGTYSNKTGQYSLESCTGCEEGYFCGGAALARTTFALALPLVLPVLPVDMETKPHRVRDLAVKIVILGITVLVILLGLAVAPVNTETRSHKIMNLAAKFAK